YAGCTDKWIDEQAECCDACNINHIQCMGRVSSSVHQLESALASGVGCVILRSIIPYKSDSLFAGAVLPWNQLSHVVEHPGWVVFCVG
ncbi:hypothetical protein KUCAC02_031153, partial [Chaenocephalus aceratus]